MAGPREGEEKTVTRNGGVEESEKLSLGSDYEKAKSFFTLIQPNSLSNGLGILSIDSGLSIPKKKEEPTYA